MSTKTIEQRTEGGITLCPLSAMADLIDKSSERKRLVINNPCYNKVMDEGSQRTTYVRKLCRGYNTSCPSHPDHIM